MHKPAVRHKHVTRSLSVHPNTPSRYPLIPYGKVVLGCTLSSFVGFMLAAASGCIREHENKAKIDV